MYDYIIFFEKRKNIKKNIELPMYVTISCSSRNRAVKIFKKLKIAKYVKNITVDDNQMHYWY